VNRPVVVDAHAHMGPGLGNWSVQPPLSARTVEELIDILDVARIDQACTFAPSWEGGDFDDFEYSKANRVIHEGERRYPDRLIGVCRINPNLATKSLDEMKRCHDDYGFKGLKLHPDSEFFSINNPLMRPFLDLAADYRWPIFLHAGFYPLSQPALLLPVAQDYPTLNFLLLHLGYRFTTDAVLIAQRCPNVFLETSADSSASAIRQVLSQLGSERVIFGSDLPTTRPAEVIDKIRMQPNLSAEGGAQVLGGNIRRLLGGAN
jgi:uncharacterized protein